MLETLNVKKSEKTGQLNLAESRSGSGSYLDIFVAIEKYVVKKVVNH
jgi:hypothetical protein